MSSTQVTSTGINKPVFSEAPKVQSTLDNRPVETISSKALNSIKNHPYKVAAAVASIALAASLAFFGIPAGVKAAAKTVGAKVAGTKVGGKVVDFVAGKKPITNASSLVLGSTKFKNPFIANAQTVIRANNSERVGGAAKAISKKVTSATRSVTNAASSAKTWTSTKLSNAAETVTSLFAGEKTRLYNGTHTVEGPRVGGFLGLFRK